MIWRGHLCLRLILVRILVGYASNPSERFKRRTSVPLVTAIVPITKLEEALDPTPDREKSASRKRS